MIPHNYDVTGSVFAVILTYYPDSDCIGRIQLLKQQFDGIIVVDNGSDEEFQDSIKEYVASHHNVCYIRNAANLGVPAGYNVGIRTAILHGAEYVTILDQDSVLPTNYRKSMSLCYSELCFRGECVGAIAPKYVDINSGKSPNITRLNRAWFTRVNGNRSSSASPEISLPIASGTMYHTDIFKVCGFYDESFFIDHFETDYNLRLRQRQYKLFLNTQCTMEHSLGARNSVRRLGLVFHPLNHSPLRKYYLYRNKCYLLARYGFTTPSLIMFEIIASVIDVTRILLCESAKISKLGMIAYGIADFCRQKSGEFKQKI